MRDHSTNMILRISKMKTEHAPFAVTALATLPLHQQFMQRHMPACKYAQVTVQGQYPLIFCQRLGNTHGYCLLTNTTKPLADLTLPQQNQHLLFDHTW